MELAAKLDEARADVVRVGQRCDDLVDALAAVRDAGKTASRADAFDVLGGIIRVAGDALLGVLAQRSATPELVRSNAHGIPELPRPELVHIAGRVDELARRVEAAEALQRARIAWGLDSAPPASVKAGDAIQPPREPAHGRSPATSPVPAESFRATELAAIRERETVSALEHDEDEEDVPIEGGPTEIALRAELAALQGKLATARAELREATGLLTDIDRATGRVWIWLDRMVKK